MEWEKLHFLPDNPWTSSQNNGSLPLESISESKPTKSARSMPKFNFGTQLDRKGSDASKDHTLKVKTFFILGAHAILLCFDLSDKNSF